MPVHLTCPECRQRKWATIQDPDNFRLKLLKCQECGFEVDTRVVIQSRSILKRDNGEDTTV